jgi:hypothetical protein
MRETASPKSPLPCPRTERVKHHVPTDTAGKRTATIIPEAYELTAQIEEIRAEL